MKPTRRQRNDSLRETRGGRRARRREAKRRDCMHVANPHPHTPPSKTWCGDRTHNHEAVTWRGDECVPAHSGYCARCRAAFRRTLKGR